MVADDESDTFDVIHEWKCVNMNGHVDAGNVSYGIGKLKLTQPLIYELAQIELLKRGTSVEPTTELEN